MNIALYVDIIINKLSYKKMENKFALLISMKYVFLIGFLRIIFLNIQKNVEKNI